MADAHTIPAKTRDRAGKGAARAVRREGLVPCVVYGENKDPLSISIDPRVIMKGLEQGHFFNTIYSIDVEGGANERALPRDVQFHPVSDAPLHVDFLRVGRNTRISVMIPVVFANEEDCPALNEGGQLAINRHEVEVNCSANAIPEELVADLAGLQIGDTIRISSISLPDGVEPTITDRDFVIANLQAATIAEPVEAEEDEEGAEEAAEEESADEGTEE
ncbi:50S ribosomal protein L25/general stress protein Ctc [Hwanghaeella sp.]|uniref:50S ribosomal protein L25/general stress protein Ctc n=1 Tax=Hwanghaeella sp. TaxID=2605943 RepID=UPI003CCC3885